MATKKKQTKKTVAASSDDSERYVKSIYPNAKCIPFHDIMHLVLGVKTIVGYWVVLDKNEDADPQNDNKSERTVPKTEHAAWEQAAKRVNRKFLKTLKNGF